MEIKDEGLRRILDKEFGEFIEHESEFRLFECPVRGCLHPNSPAFTISKKTKAYKCFDCGSCGPISTLLGNKGRRLDAENSQVEEEPQAIFQHEFDPTVGSAFNNLSIAKKDSLTDQYLKSRSLDHSVWSDLDLPLKEGRKLNGGMVAVYPFVDDKKRIVATQSVRLLDNQSFSKKDRRYLGKKSLGVGLLKDLPKVIVSEGLETGLSVRQYLGNEYGLIVCGDAGNMVLLADCHEWVLRERTEIIIAADNDVENTGIKAARAIYYRFLKKSKLYLPSRPRTDWNDVLISNQMLEEWV